MKGIAFDTGRVYRSDMAPDDDAPFPFSSADEWDNHPRFEPLQPVLDRLSRRALGMTHAEATTQKVCIRCHRSVYSGILATVEDAREWRISGVCGECWTDLFPDEEDGA